VVGELPVQPSSFRKQAIKSSRLNNDQNEDEDKEYVTESDYEPLDDKTDSYTDDRTFIHPSSFRNQMIQSSRLEEAQDADVTVPEDEDDTDRNADRLVYLGPDDRETLWEHSVIDGNTELVQGGRLGGSAGWAYRRNSRTPSSMDDNLVYAESLIQPTTVQAHIEDIYTPGPRLPMRRPGLKKATPLMARPSQPQHPDLPITGESMYDGEDEQ
jgi:hypothetical protein